MEDLMFAGFGLVCVVVIAARLIYLKKCTNSTEAIQRVWDEKTETEVTKDE